MKRVVRFLITGVIALVALVVAVAMLPCPVDPVAYVPEPGLPLTGALAPNDALARAERIMLPPGCRGPETVGVDARGRIVTGTEEGEILSREPSGEWKVLGRTGGRPLGVEPAPGGGVLIADADRGLLVLGEDGHVTVLAAPRPKGDVALANDTDFTPDGTIYFSDSSTKFTIRDHLLDVLEARPNGRLWRLKPGAPQPELLLSGLYFPNGVALSKTGDFVLVNETYRYRIRRVWLKGPKAGASDIFIDGLPGFPDGMSRDERGHFWVAIFTVRNKDLALLGGNVPLKRFLSRLPYFLWPRPDPYGFVLELDEEGHVVSSFQEPGGAHVKEVTSAVVAGGKLYLGTLHDPWLSVLRIGSAPAP